MILHWPQITLLALYGISIGIIWAKHGQLKTGKENVGVQFIGIIINAIILYFGGFWGKL